MQRRHWLQRSLAALCFGSEHQGTSGCSRRRVRKDDDDAQLESVASEDASMLRQPCLCSKRHFSSLFESFELGIEAEESPRGRLDGGSVGDELQPELTKSERSEHLYVSVLI